MSPLVTLLILGLLLVVVIVLLVWAITTAALAPQSARTADRHEALAREAHPREIRRGTERRKARVATVRLDDGQRRDDLHEPEPAPAQRADAARRSNDDIRGAKAAPRPSAPDDAFERFLRSGRDDER